MDKDDIDEIVKKVGYAPTELPIPEEVKEKKSRNKKSDKDKNKKKSDKKSNKKDSDRDRKRRKKPQKQKEKSTNGLPRPSYDGLSGGKEGKKDKKRPSPGKSDGAFGWIKKLFD